MNPDAGLRSAVAGLLALMLLIAPAAQALQYGDVVVNAQAPERAYTTHGYAEYRFTISNRSPSEPRRVELAMGGGGTLRSMRRVADVPPLTTVEVSLLQPAVMSYIGGVVVTIDGERQREFVNLSSAEHANNYYGYTSPALVSRRVTGDTFDLINKEIHRVLTAPPPGSGVSSPYGYGPYSAAATSEYATRAESEIQNWSHQWLAYTRWDGIVLTGEDWRVAPEPVRDALWRYLVAGGSIVVFGQIDVPPPWRDRVLRPVSDDLAIAQYEIGAGCLWSIDPANAEGTADPSRVRKSVTEWSDGHWRQLHTLWGATAQPFRHRPGLENANRQFPIVENVGIPARGMLVLMVVFALTIGPLNLVVTSRLNRRVWLLWTTPLIALVFSGAVFGYALVAEGWNAEGRTLQLTLLDQRSRLATSFGLTAFYAPLTPSGGLHFTRDTEITPLADTSPWSGETSPLYMDWTVDQHLTSGWVTARVPAQFMVRKSETRRERLQVTRDEAGDVVAVNGLGAPITKLAVADETGAVYEAQDVAPGAKVTLAKASWQASGRYSVRGIYLQQWTSGMVSARDPATLLAPMTYVAVLDGAPFIERGLERVKKMRSEAVVYGLLEEIGSGNPGP